MVLCNLCDKVFDYEFEKLMRLFLPFEKIEVIHEPPKSEEFALCREKTANGEKVLAAALALNGERAECFDALPPDDSGFKKECERRLSVCLFNCFIKITGYKPPFGILTGVRPARLFSKTAEEKGLRGAKDYFEKMLLCEPEKISLCEETYKSEESITALSSFGDFSLYIGIPFCPTRCSYCSFVSHSVANAGELILPYVDKLCEEIKITARIAADLGLTLKTVYMGGGTPTTLSAESLKKIFSAVKENFNLKNITEYTVEAGRPDTVTAEKLYEIKNSGATRISINPQTMNDEVLKAIGRNHTASDTEKAFLLARECGFDNINTDLIAGLPGDTFDSFVNTVSRVLKLEPESITVHSLSMKRASRLSGEGKFPEIEMGKTAEKMVDYARLTLKENGYNPYYMYRQSKTVGNLENTGYSKRGYEGLYNVYIMDETHTIMACGAGAVTKLRNPDGSFIERIFNFKYPYEYIGRFDEQMQRKGRIKEFYENYT